jgi:hypothetical protein
MKNYNQFITERLKNMDSFNEKVISILTDEFGNIEPEYYNTSMTRYVIDSKYGKLRISLHNDKSELYSIFMQFMNPSSIIFGSLDIPSEMNPYSGKWNIHTMDEAEALLEFEKRIKQIK